MAFGMLGSIMIRIAALLCAAAICGEAAGRSMGAAATAEPSSATISEAELVAIVGRLASRQEPMTPAVRDELAAAVDAAAARWPDDARWAYGQAVVAWRRWELDRARTLMRRVVALDPGRAEYWTTLGTVLFQSVIGQRDLDALRICEEGVAAYERALEIDPGVVEARIGLGFFAAAAPGWAGGSYRRARQQAEALGALEHGRGAYGRLLVLAQVEQAKGNWERMRALYREAERATGEGGGAINAKLAHAGALLAGPRDWRGVLEVVQEGEGLTGEGHPFWPYFLALRGQALVELGRYIEAEAALRRAAELNTPPAAALLARARALDRLGRGREALPLYRAYVERFGRTTAASEARRAIRRLERMPAG